VAGGGNAVSGLGDDFTRVTGLNARDPSTIDAQIDFALDQAAKGGWGPWHGAANSGIGRWQGIGQAGAPQITSPSAPAYAAAPPSGVPAPQLAGAVPTQDTGPGEPRLIAPGQPQTGPAYSDETWNNRPQYDYGAQAPQPSTVPLPPQRPQDQPPLLNGGQPGVYSMPDKQGMNEPGDLMRGMKQERDYFTNPIHTIPPGSPDMPKSLAPLPGRQFPTGAGNLGVADSGPNPLAAALAAGGQDQQQLPNPALIAALLSGQGGLDTGDNSGLFG
jgi:hypothetical protein